MALILSGDTTYAEQSAVDALDPRSATAWVFFDGSGTILDSYNISTVTAQGISQYDIDFSTNMDNTNYVMVGSAITDSTGADYAFVTEDGLTARTVAGFRITISDHAGSSVSEEGVSLVIYGGKA